MPGTAPAPDTPPGFDLSTLEAARWSGSGGPPSRLLAATVRSLWGAIFAFARFCARPEGGRSREWVAFNRLMAQGRPKTGKDPGLTLKKVRSPMVGITATPRPDDERLAECALDDVVPGLIWSTVRTRPRTVARGCVCYIHGGGYVASDFGSYAHIAFRLLRTIEMDVGFVTYRLAPEARIQAGNDDCVAAVRRMLDLGYERVFLLADSAGGGHAIRLMQRLRDEQGSVPVAGAALMSPLLDLTMTAPSWHDNRDRDILLSPETLAYFVTTALDGQDPTSPEVSPLLGDLAGLPPIWVCVGDTELLLSDSERLAAAVREAGGTVDLRVVEHAFHCFPVVWHRVPEASELLDEIERFFVRLSST